MQSLQRSVVLIPAYNPVEHLITLVEELRGLGFMGIVVVDDGSRQASGPVFAQLDCMAAVDVLRHEINRGKGASLRLGFKHILARYPEARGVVTADADGQHLGQDIRRVGLALSRTPDALVLGTRQFGGDVPWRSKLGNRTTRLLLRLLLGMKLQDTQTGLRGIPARVLPRLIDLTTGRYAFELDMLLSLENDGLAISQLPIATVYEEAHQISHFRPLADSLRIYRVLVRHVFATRLVRFFKYSLSSILSTLVDYTVYYLLLIPARDYVTASVVARIFSVTTHFLVVGFRCKGRVRLDPEEPNRCLGLAP